MGRITDLRLDTLSLEQDGRVVTARYGGPPLNFVTTGFLRDLDTLTAAADRDDSVGAVIVTGGVEGRFLTHADPDELRATTSTGLPELPPGVLLPMWRLVRAVLRVPGALRAAEAAGSPVLDGLAWAYRWRRTTLRMNRSSTVYLAAINGPTTGGGHEIALACDLRFASDAPHVRLGQIEILAGLIPGGGGTQRLPRIVGTAAAVEHMLDGTPLTAEQAHRLGLVSAVVPADRLVGHVQEVATRLSRRSPGAIRSIKRLAYAGAGGRLGAGLDRELAAFVAAGMNPAMEPTLRAFTADAAERGDSPLASGDRAWVEGTRVPELVPSPEARARRKFRQERLVGRYLANPAVRALARAGMRTRFATQLETTGRRSGERRRVPVVASFDDTGAWIISQHGRRSGWAANIEADPRVRLQQGRRWRSATATLVPDDDVTERARGFAPHPAVGALTAGAFRALASAPISVRVSFTDDPSGGNR